eukprot:TRINITY_DN7504_c0_g1_i2.p3 TRINITY_DN7504_c0_g1~~TRINITY_DN7504_c0_g1_i2.p3  ORF type:complete len:116 (+),score=4.37 TRINITY_DN7504_c0_g1_i2:294-641(+)
MLFCKHPNLWGEKNCNTKKTCVWCTNDMERAMVCTPSKAFPTPQPSPTQVFLNFVDDQAVLLPNWQPPPSFAAMPPGKGRGPPMAKGGKPSKGGKGGKGTKGGKKPGYGPPPGYY